MASAATAMLAICQGRVSGAAKWITSAPSASSRAAASWVASRRWRRRVSAALVGWLRRSVFRPAAAMACSTAGQALSGASTASVRAPRSKRRPRTAAWPSSARRICASSLAQSMSGMRSSRAPPAASAEKSIGRAATSQAAPPQSGSAWGWA